MTGGKEEVDNRKKAKRNKEGSGETKEILRATRFRVCDRHEKTPRSDTLSFLSKQ